MSRFILLTLFSFLSACATGANQYEDNTDYSHPAAYTVEGFYLDKPPPPHLRPVIEGSFFRQCDRASKGSYFSKSAYDCSYK